MTTLTEFLLARIADTERHVEFVRDLIPDEGNQGEYIDPSRVLAECAAKRRIVELHYSWDLQAERAPEPLKPILKTQVITADTALRVLAAVYSDHPEFRAEWRA